MTNQGIEGNDDGREDRQLVSIVAHNLDNRRPLAANQVANPAVSEDPDGPSGQVSHEKSSLIKATSASNQAHGDVQTAVKTARQKNAEHAMSMKTVGGSGPSGGMKPLDLALHPGSGVATDEVGTVVTQNDAHQGEGKCELPVEKTLAGEGSGRYQ